MRKKTKNRIENEKRVVAFMIEHYCRKHHRENRLCDECRSLSQYSEAKLDKCIFGQDKPACSSCRVHCYQPEMRNKIKKVMKYVGPRMIFLKPIEIIRHFFHGNREKIAVAKTKKFVK
ncbi:MAG TPA: nitrous oxide-stimulated promoter family protein [Smithellaceae bacterium]|nr:nitrous oxide-stimulated promoter family protein [Smithellaceae bacterium]